MGSASFGDAYESFPGCVGRRFGTADRTRHGDEGIRNGYDRISLQAINIKAILQRMQRTGHLGPEI